MTIEKFRLEVKNRERFEFGKNWKNFLNKLSEERIKISEESLLNMLNLKNLKGKSFIDVGSGSGLFSLAALNKGAKVTSFDFDESSVWCTSELKRQFFNSSEDWNIFQGSVLDKSFLSSLGKYDIVYSWGVLHHTGQMWHAIDNSLELTKKNGLYFIAIYNDQGIKSHIWWMIKYFYNKLPSILKLPFAFVLGFLVNFLMIIKYTIKLKPMVIIRPLLNYKDTRGMSLFSDIIDWYGGFPFEFAEYQNIIDYIENKGFTLINGKKASSLGCHELVFVKK